MDIIPQNLSPQDKEFESYLNEEKQMKPLKSKIMMQLTDKEKRAEIRAILDRELRMNLLASIGLQ